MGRKYFIYIAVTLTVAITVGSLISIKGESAIPVHFSDKFVHFVAYFLLTLSWFFVYNSKPRLLKSYVSIAMLVFVYGIIIEVLQSMFTKTRVAESNDILANTFGVGVTITILFRFKKTDIKK